jgi:hypothetical protein
MTIQEHILAALRAHCERWQDLQAGPSKAQIAAPFLEGGRSIRDQILHLWPWQQASLARMEAALSQREPEFPPWLAELPGDGEQDRANQCKRQRSQSQFDAGRPLW